MTPTGRAAFLSRLLGHYFGLTAEEALSSKSWRDVLSIAPGRVASFLDDLRCDHGFDISAADADGVDSARDLARLIDLRHPYASASEDSAA